MKKLIKICLYLMVFYLPYLILIFILINTIKRKSPRISIRLKILQDFNNNVKLDGLNDDGLIPNS
jgi:hypothetical protein